MVKVLAFRVADGTTAVPVDSLADIHPEVRGLEQSPRVCPNQETPELLKIDLFLKGTQRHSQSNFRIKQSIIF